MDEFDLTGFLGDILGGAAGAGLAYSAYNTLDKLAGSVREDVAPIAEQTAQMAQFQPFAVRSALGGAQVGPTGGVDISLSPQQQALQNFLGTGAQGLFGAAMGTPQTNLGGFNFGQMFAQTDPQAYTRTAANKQLAYGLGNQSLLQAMQGPADISGFYGSAGARAMPQAGLGGLGQGFLGLAGQAAGGIDTQMQDYTQGLLSAGRYGQAGTGAYGDLGDFAGTALGQAQQFLGRGAGDPGDVYERIRAVQRPEEERQRLALEERLFNQGRGGVRTSMFGGTPEQLAMSKAQAEAQNQAALQALQFAQQEEAQNIGLGGQLAQMGQSATGLRQNLISQNLSDILRTGQAGQGSQMQQANLAGMLSGLGGQNLQLQSALASQGLGDVLGLQQAELARQQQFGNLGLGLSQLGQAGTALQQNLANQNIQNILGISQGQLAQQAGLGNLASTMMQQQYAPQAALLNLLGAGTQTASLADAARRQAAGLFGEAQMGGLEAQLAAKLGQANLAGQLGSGLISGVFGGGGNSWVDIIRGALGGGQ